MFVALSKLLDLLVAPLTWAVLLVALGLAVAARRPRRGAAIGALGLALLIAFSLEPVARRLVLALERGAVSTFRPAPPYDAVILLSGMTDLSASRASGDHELTGAADRLVRTAAVLRAGQARAVLITGGPVFARPGEPSEPERLRALLVGLGVDPARIVLEARSRNTRENAVESARIVAERGWERLLLVTSAAHVPRALGCFRAVGLAPDVLPVDRRAGDGRGAQWLPRASALDAATDAIRELTGRIVYRVRGWSRPETPAPPTATAP